MLLFLSWIGYRALARGRSSVNFGVLAFLVSFFGIAGSLFTRTTRIWRRSTPSSPSWSANAVESSRSFGQDMVNMLYTLTRNCLMRFGCLRNSILSNYLRVLTTGNRSGWCFVGTGRFCVVLSLANKLVVLGIDTLSMKTVDLEVYLAAFLFRPSGISDYYCEFGIEIHLSFVRSMLVSSIEPETVKNFTWYAWGRTRCALYWDKHTMQKCWKAIKKVKSYELPLLYTNN